MYLMYVDESGDSGLINSPTRYFVLSGLVMHELRWQAHLDHLVNFRRNLRTTYGLKLREEFHAGAMLTHPSEAMKRIRKHERLAMIRHFADYLSKLAELSIINVVIDKRGKTPDYDVFEMAWKILIQRFENTLSHHNFPGPRNADDRGLLLCDHTEDKRVRAVMRQMRKFNPVPHHPYYPAGGHRNIPLLTIIEDPNFRDSEHSFFIQAVDLAAFLIYQSVAPNRYMRNNSGQNYYRRLAPILCRHASRTDAYGIVRL